MVREVQWDKNRTYDENIHKLTSHRQNDPYERQDPDSIEPPRLQSYITKI